MAGGVTAVVDYGFLAVRLSQVWHCGKANLNLLVVYWAERQLLKSSGIESLYLRRIC